MKSKQLFRNKILIGVLIFLLVVGVLINAIFLLNRRVIVRGVKIAGISTGGMKPAKAREVLEKATQRWHTDSIKLTLKQETIKTTWEAIGFKFNLDKTIENALKVGRKRNIFFDLENQILALFGQHNINLEVQWNEQVIENFTQLHFADYLEESKNASLVYEQGAIKLVPSSSGRQLNWNTFKQLVKTKANKLEPINSYKFKLINVYPAVKDDETKKAKDKAEDLLKATPFRVVLEDKGWDISQEELAKWFLFKPVFEKKSENQVLGLDLDKELITSFLLKIVPQINRSFKDARLGFENEEIVITEVAKPGIEVLLEESANKVYESILNEQPKIELVIKEVPAILSEETLSELKIDTLLAEGESDYTGSSLSRVNNIKVGSSKFDGHLIKPDEEFSFNETLGEISGKEGYLPGLVIKEDKLVPEYGGGICQVSTTMFRAAVKSGLKITERYPHSFPVSYYNPQGFDATVYPPHPDLRFKDNTPGYVLIQRRIEGNRLTFEMYGKDQEREVKVKGPYIYDRDTEKDTFRTVLWQEVYDKDDELLFKDGFWSFYDSPANYPVATEEEEEKEDGEEQGQEGEEEEDNNITEEEATEEN